MRPRLFFQVLSLEARSRMSYRADFWINAVAGFAVELVVIWFLWKAMYHGKEILGGRTFDETLVYFLAAILIGKLVRGQAWEAAISSDIYEGSLTRYLVFPIRYLPFKYAQRLGSLAPGVVQFLLFGIVAYFWLGAELHVSAASVAMALAAIAVASFLYYLIDYCIHVVAFWADNVWSLDVGKWFAISIFGGYLLPLSVFPPWAQGILEVLPFRVFFDLPVRALIGEMDAAVWARGMALAFFWCFVFLAIGRFAWRRGRLQYTGVGI